LTNGIVQAKENSQNPVLRGGTDCR
jgi:hypothetical protein